VPAELRRNQDARFPAPVGFRRFDGTTRLHVDVRRPRGRDVLVGGEQFARHAIEHVEETVLRRLHQHLARFAFDRQVGKDDVLRRGVVPVLLRRRLVVPLQMAVVGIDREDRRQEQVVAAAR
jgi:hypothetical protein